MVDTSGNREQGGVVPVPAAASSGPRAEPAALEVMNEVDIENVGMEYDVVSSEGHAAKPRCTHQEKVQILQYALEHSIKEASQKFGISPGTLYYWKKNLSGEKTGTGANLALPVTPEGGSASVAVMNVQYTGESGVMQALNSSGSPAVISPEQLLTGGTTAENLQALTQTLASMTPETLQNLPADVNLLQAVSSYLSNIEAESESQKHKTDVGRRRVSSSGGISSPTEVLVAPFQPSSERMTSSEVEGDAVPQVASLEEVPIAEGSETAEGSDISVGMDECDTAQSLEEPPQLPLREEGSSVSVGELSVGENTETGGGSAESSEGATGGTAGLKENVPS